MMSPEEPPQNIYDDSEFFAGYSQMERFQGAFGRAMEHGLFLEMAGSVAGLRVLDLGCGGGQLAHHLASAGAASVTAIEVSERMLANAGTIRRSATSSSRWKRRPSAKAPSTSS